MEKKTHYRKVFKSDHLGVADLEEFIEEGKRLVFTIKEVKQEFDVRVAGIKGNHNIAYFNEPIKPMVLNATNSKVIRSFCKNSSFIEDWGNTIIELYIDLYVKMKGETVGGVRVRPNQPLLSKPILDPNNKSWEKAKKAVERGGATFESISKNYSITKENFKLLCG